LGLSQAKACRRDEPEAGHFVGEAAFMFCGKPVYSLRTLVLAFALLAYPCGMLAQRGGGGGHIGGGTAGGGAMGSGGAATGLDVKDDLKDFHETLALQASSQQLIDYKLMLKSTESASTELQAFLQQAAKENNVSGVADRDKSFEPVLDKARTANTAFLQKLSDRQKIGLKETIKKLAKTDSDLAQQDKALGLALEDTKSGGAQIASSLQNLEHTLTSFHTQQLDLGEEMSMAGDGSRDTSFNILPVKSSVEFSGKAIAISTSGVVSKGMPQSGGDAFRLGLTADLSDLQLNIAEVLRAQLDKADRCGEQIAVQSATLTPTMPASVVLVQVHYERWACFGKATPNEMVEGNGTIEVKVTPEVGEKGSLGLAAAIGRVDAQGLVGELLRSGTLGEVVREKVTESLLSTVRQASDCKVLLPPVARDNVTFERARFQETGPGRLSIVLDGNIQLSSDKASLLTSELKAGEARSSTAQATAETSPH
jgi:hypothetical protein